MSAGDPRLAQLVAGWGDARSRADVLWARRVRIQADALLKYDHEVDETDTELEEGRALAAIETELIEAEGVMEKNERGLVALRVTSVADVLAKLDVALKIAPAPEDERCQWAALVESCRDDIAGLLP